MIGPLNQTEHGDVNSECHYSDVVACGPAAQAVALELGQVATALAQRRQRPHAYTARPGYFSGAASEDGRPEQERHHHDGTGPEESNVVRL